MPRPSPHPNPTVRRVMFVLGWISLLLGVIGVLLPIIPTGPFVIVAALCFLESSPRFYRWLSNHNVLGFYVRSYLEGRGLPENTKLLTIGMLWVMMLTTALFIVDIEWLSTVLLLIAVAVSAYIAAMPEPE